MIGVHRQEGIDFIRTRSRFFEIRMMSTPVNHSDITVRDSESELHRIVYAYFTIVAAEQQQSWHRNKSGRFECIELKETARDQSLNQSGIHKAVADFF